MHVRTALFHIEQFLFYFFAVTCCEEIAKKLFDMKQCLQCFDAVGWATGRASGLYKTAECWGAGVVICLERGADLHMAQLMPLPLTVSCFSKIQIGLPFSLVLAGLGSPGKRRLNVCVCVYVCCV